MVILITARHGDDVIRFHSEYRCPDDLIINRFEIFRSAEHNVSRTFNLLDRPCIELFSTVCFMRSCLV